jgi:hypothetical protein
MANRIIVTREQLARLHSKVELLQMLQPIYNVSQPLGFGTTIYDALEQLSKDLLADIQSTLGTPSSEGKIEA